MRINIVSGNEMALYQDNLGFRQCIPFAESMISGKVTQLEPFSNSFIEERAKANNTGIDKYRKSFVNQLLKMRSGDEVHVYFGEDLFCQLNLITLLCYLERIGIKSVTYHVVFEDEMKEVALIENLETKGFCDIYKSVLIEKNTAPVPLEIMQKALLLYSDYLDDNGTLATFIKDNPEDSILKLSVKIIKQFARYGLSDVQCKEVITRVRKSQESTINN